MGVSTVHNIVSHTCHIIWEVMSPVQLKEPNVEEWERIEKGFSMKWNYPNCIGDLDEKHIVIQAPHNSGSLFFNYKGTFSLVLMALVDADYRFVFVDIGDYGSNADGAVFKNSTFGQAFINGQLNVPPHKHLPHFPEGGPLPHCFVADEAFPLRVDLMRPYPRGRNNNRLRKEQQIFNYRLSRARRIVENAFGILAQRWRLFNRRIGLNAKNTEVIVKACIVLHNYLTEKKEIAAIYNRLNPDGDPYLQEDGAILDLPNLHGYHSPQHVRATRDVYTQYFMRPEGSLTWQERAIVS